MGKRFTDQEVLDEIRRVAEIVGESPSTTQFNEHAEITHMVPAHRFGSWNDAKDLIDLDVDERRRGEQSKTVWYDKQKDEGECERCGEDFGPALSYHHRDPDEKVAGVRVMRETPYSEHTLEDMKAEVEKCALLCQNCHRKVHHEDHPASI
jgi:5-methylcytosine-specific restriction endonuclease McrA